MEKIGIAMVIIGCIILFVASLPKEEEEEKLWLNYNIVQITDSTHAFNAIVVKLGDIPCGMKVFEYKTRNVDYIVSYQKAYKEMWDWYSEIVFNKE